MNDRPHPLSPATPVAAGYSKVSPFNYNDGTGFYPSRSRQRASGHRFRRFETPAEALRFALEELPVALLRSSVMEVDEARFDSAQMQALYEADDYPLMRSNHCRKR
jgi:hypothetical protein